MPAPMVYRCRDSVFFRTKAVNDRFQLYHVRQDSSRARLGDMGVFDLPDDQGMDAQVK